MTHSKNLMSVFPGKRAFFALALLAAPVARAAGDRLPVGYTEVEYIQGNGSNARFVTDYTPKPNIDKIEAVVEWPANTLNANQAVWCSRGNGLQVDSLTLLYINDNKKFRFDYMPNGHAVSLSPDFTPTTETKYTITAEDNTVTYSANGSVLQSQTTPAYTYTAGSVLALFASHYNGINGNVGNYGKQRLYSFKVWWSGNLIHYFVPCKDTGGNATLVDLCDNPATLTKSGTFTAGPEGHYYDDSLFGVLSILSIPDQLCLPADTPEPGFIVTNTETGATWVFAEGGVASGSTPFDVAYSFADGYGTVTVTGKAGGGYEGETVKSRYKLTRELLVNGGFESGAWVPGWTASGNYANIDTSASAYRPNDATTFISGTYCAILQKQNVASQVFTNDAPWCAELSWKCKQRSGSSNIPYSVMIDGECIFYEDFPTGTSEVHYRTVEDILLQPGEHTLTFQTLATIDRTLFLDDVSCRIVSRAESGDFDIDPIERQFTASGGCFPEPVVHYGGTLLSKDTDYTVAYSNNTAPGIASITITGIGTYAGKVGSVVFVIRDRLYAKPTVAVEGDGHSWGSAMSWTNALAVAVAASGYVEIWLSGDITLSAAPSTLTFTKSIAIRGGFAGTENSPDERVAGAKSTIDGQGEYTIMTIANVASAPVVLDGLRIFNGARGIMKTGAGDISILNCEIVGNFLTTSSPNGTGLALTGTADARLVVSNCVISGNGCGPTMITNIGSGQGLYVSTFGSAVIEDTTFLTNGIAWTGRDLWNEGRDGQAGAAIYLNNVPATVRRCVFRGNRGNCNNNRGGIVRVAGASGGTLFEHCVFAGNEEDHHTFAGKPAGGNNGGQIAISLSTEDARVTIGNCTIAGNFSDNTVSAAGVTVAKGTVVIKNSIIANNIVHPTNTGGADLALVDPTAHAEVSYSLLSADGPSSYSSVNVDNLSFGAGVRFGDPALVSSASDVEGLLVMIPGSAASHNIRQFDKARLDEVLGIDVHALSPAGYFTNDGTEHVSGGDFSPAIDAGDPLDPVGSEPSPNGGVVNAGAYGGTTEASKTPAGEPAVDGQVTITFDEEYSRPTVHFTVGGEGAFFATANVFISTDGSSWSLMNTLPGLANGTAVDCPIDAYYAPGSIRAKVILSANGTVAEATSAETPVTKDLPPWWGKGGPANVIHVRPGAIGAGTGENWSDAVPNLRSAFSLVNATKNEIWIAGTNVLTAGSVTLNAANPLSVKGGFHGWENSAAEREEGFRSVIDGDEVTDCLTIANSAAVEVERIYFTRGLNCGLIKTGAGDMLVSDCHFVTNGMGRATNASGKGARVGGTTTTTVVTFVDCVFRGNRAKSGSDGGCSASGAGINASSLKCLRLEDCYFVHNGIHLRAPGGGSSYEPSSGSSYGSAVYSTAPVSAVGCRFAANFGNVRNNDGDTKDGGFGGVVRLYAGAEGSAFTNCAWVANGDQIVWQGYGTGGKNIAGALTVQFASKEGTVDVDNCTFAYNLADGYETTAGLNLILGTANVRNSIFFGNILGGASKTRGRDISLRGESVLNVAYTMFGEEGTNSISCAETATTNFLDGVVFGDPLLMTENDTMTNLVKESTATAAGGSKLIFWDWTAANAEATYAALENANVHLRSKNGYVDEKTGELVKVSGVVSPAVDAGDPASDYSGEPSGRNGHRVNLGAYGNTPWATMSPASGLQIILR